MPMLATCPAPAALAKPLDMRAILGNAAQDRTLSAEQILARALDNLFGFDSAMMLEVERRTAGGTRELSQFMLQRARRGNARRLLATSLLPDAVRGNRVLQVDYDDGREETFAFLPRMGGPAMRTSHRLADPFLATWHEIGAGEPSARTRVLTEYEVLAFSPVTSAGEAAYELSLRSIVPRGYDRTELIVARSDYAILEQRYYTNGSSAPALIAETLRANMIRFEGHLVPARITYRDPTRGETLDVRIRHAPLAEGSESMLLPSTFQRMPLPDRQGAPPTPAEPTEPR